MKKALTLIFLFLSSWRAGSAHDPNQAFFKITLVNNHVLVEAEFPWTLRNTLLEFKPELENAKTKEEFLNALEEYVKLNLILTKENGETYKITELQEIENSGHSHQNNFVFSFSGTGLSTIKNTMMFDYSDKQVNFHVLEKHEKEVKFETSKNNPDFVIETHSSMRYTFWILGFTLIGLTFAGLFFRKKLI